MLTLIRTHASSAVGLGHLRRCLSLASALRERGGDVWFGLNRSDVDASAIVRAEGFQACTFELSDEATEAEDAHAFVSCLVNAQSDGQRVDWVLVDHYGLRAPWHTMVADQLGCRLAAIDDLADRPLAVDMLIDHNYVPHPGHRNRYAPCMRRTPDAWLCGPRFALLGPAYQHRPPFTVAAQVRSVGIFLGGTDPAALSVIALQACRTVAGFEGPIEVVSTSANPHLADLRKAVAQDEHTRLSIDLPDLAGFFARHDLQIGAGGGATWERCCTGVPTLTLCVAANQVAVIPGLRDLGALVTTTDNSAASIGLALRNLIDSPDQRRALSAGGQALVDGRGAERVACSMFVHGGWPLALRPATLEDSHTLWSWRNDPATRAASRQGKVIAWDTHTDWFARTLADPGRVLWVAHLQGCRVGVIRFDAMADGRQEVSLYLDPGLHGLGLGAALLSAGELALAQRLGPTEVHAEVLPDNPTSQRLFQAAGYQATSALTYSKTISTTVATGAARRAGQQEPH